MTGFLPKRLSWGTFSVVALALCVATCWIGVLPLIWAAVATGLATGAFYLVWKLTNLGFGDVRLAALVGLVSGSSNLNGCLAALLIGCGTGAIQGVIRAFRKLDGSYPFGPALVIGCFLSVPVNALLLPLS